MTRPLSLLLVHVNLDRAIVSQVDEVAVIEEVVKNGHTSTIWRKATKTFMLCEGVVEVANQ